MTEPVQKLFTLATAGEDPEIDTIGIAVVMFQLLNDDQARRVIQYLHDRYYTRSGDEKHG
jgi:hypothetical protein